MRARYVRKHALRSTGRLPYLVRPRRCPALPDLQRLAPLLHPDRAYVCHRTDGSRRCTHSSRCVLAVLRACSLRIMETANGDDLCISFDGSRSEPMRS
jgi:hypothetical protein